MDAITTPLVSAATRDELAEICLRHTIDTPDVVIPEPYVPFIPERWNGVLVLGEAQNLSDTNGEYVARLRSATPADRVRRLSNAEDIGVQPWDDGSLKFAVLSVWPDQPPETYAVSNAVLWSVNSGGPNANPTGMLKGKSVALWRELFAVLRPGLVIAAGAVAREVISAAFTGNTLFVRLPAKQAMSRVSGMLSEEGLFAGFAGVKAACAMYPQYAAPHMGQSRQNKIYYACHFASAAKDYLPRESAF